MTGRLFSKAVAGFYDPDKLPNCSVWRARINALFFVMFCATLLSSPTLADAREYFEKWTKSEGFDVGYACNWWKDVPGPESMFAVKKLKSAEFLADVDTVEFRMVKPNSAKGTIDSYNGSLFTVRVDREAGSVTAIRVVYAFTKNGSCSFIVKAAENSSIAVLRGADAPNIAASPKALRWIDRSIPECYRRLRRAVDPNILFDCVRSIDPNSTKDQPSEGLWWESVMPEGVVPASVARIFIQNRGKTFAVTTFGDTIEILEVSAP